MHLILSIFELTTKQEISVEAKEFSIFFVVVFYNKINAAWKYWGSNENRLSSEVQGLLLHKFVL